MNCKLICLAFSLLICVASYGQERPAFRIITFDRNVTLDGVPVAINQQVTSASKKLDIPDGGYAGVLLPWGIIKRLGPGINDIETLGSAKIWLASQRAVMDGGPAIQPAGINHFLLGDSVYLWWVNPITKPLKLRVANVFDDPYLDTLVQQQIIIKNFRRFFKERNKIVIEIRQDKKNSEGKFVSTVTDELRQKLEHDLSQIQNHPDKDVLTIAILETHDLHLDAAVRLSRMKSARENLPADLKEYVRTLRSKLGMDK